MTTKLGFIGGGHMTSSLIHGLANSSGDGEYIDCKDIWVFDRNQHKVAALAEKYGIQVADDNEHLVGEVDSLVLSIKPQALQASITPLSELLRAKNMFLISVAAGIRTNSINEWLGGGFAISRAMPNMGSAVGLGATGMYANDLTSDTQKIFTSRLMSATGLSEWVNTEADIDSVTALSGSGPAYFMLFIKHLIDAAVDSGLDHDVAEKLALQTARGSIELIEQSEKSINDLVDSICLAGGTTEQAVASFNRENLAMVVETAFSAAKNRAEELADQLSK